MNRAKEIAEVLFPTAEIKTFNVDLKDGNQIEKWVKLETLFPYLPRVHLLSNIIDLFDDVKAFASSVSRVCARPYPHEDGSPGFIYNEIFVAFSPDYRGGRVKDNVNVFRAAWGKLASDLTLLGDAPLNCEYAAFAFNQLGVSSAYKLFAGGNFLFRRTVDRRKVVVPTVVYVGGDDRVVDSNAARLWFADVPCARIVDCPGASHVIPLNYVWMWVISEISDKQKERNIYLK